MESFVKHISNDIPDRFEWAIDVMKIHPADAVLEIGCGTGILAEQICKTLSGGNFAAVDRSEEMIAKAMKRNQRFITSGIASFQWAEFPHVDLPDKGFNCIVSFNVPFFRNHPRAELVNIRQLLKPGGSLFIFHQPPSDHDMLPIRHIREQLSKNGFTVLKTELKDIEPAKAYCIKAIPA